MKPSLTSSEQYVTPLNSPTIAAYADNGVPATSIAASGTVPGADAAGEQACRQSWDRIRKLDAGFWLTLPLAGASAGQDLLTPDDMSDATVPYAAIALEANRSLDQGVRRNTPLALLLLAAVALDRFDDSFDDKQAALTLARTALDLSGRAGSLHDSFLQALHAALFLPCADGLRDAAAVLTGISQSEAPPQTALLYLAGAGLAAGMPLPELSRHLDSGPRAASADDATAVELAARTALLRCLLHRQTDVNSLDTGAAPDAGQEARFGYWLTQLLTAWYAGNHAAALQAVDKASELIGPLTPVADRLSYHLFAALSLAHAENATATVKARRHSAALHKWAAHCPASASAIAALASAAINRRASEKLDALRGFELAAATAFRQGQHWVASLAWEQAVILAHECGLGSASQHYSQQALAACRQWGAAGRLDTLQRAWSESGGAESSARQADHERSLWTGTGGELGLSIAHEVNQPLAAIMLHAAAARKWLRRAQPDLERALASLTLISTAGRNAGEIVRSVQRLAAREENEVSTVAVDQTITEALQLLHRPVRKHGVEIVLALGLGDATIEANRVQLQQVVVNLLVNAVEALSASSVSPRRIRLESRRYNEHEIEIAVADNGPGIAPENRERVFGSLYSTKPNSTGMGLSISMAIVRAHGGQIELEPCEPHGACFRFRLPVRALASASIRGN
jgi:signal transduction histidine kinase